MDFYSNKRRIKKIRYFLAFALLILFFINCYNAYCNNEMINIQLISNFIVLLALFFSFYNRKNIDK